jgi:hypothetical protein
VLGRGVGGRDGGVLELAGSYLWGGWGRRDGYAMRLPDCPVLTATVVCDVP